MVADFFVSVITSAAVTAALVWLVKSWISERLKNAIKSEYDQKLETHKAQLKAQSDVEIERLRSQLNITGLEHGVRFSKLHEKRAEVIAETYALLKVVSFRLGDFVKIFESAGDSSREERRNAAAKAHEEFRSYYTAKLIFFPSATASKLEEINVQLVKIFNEFVFTVERSKGADKTANWIELFNRVNDEMPAALKELESEFRKLLGDESECSGWDGHAYKMDFGPFFVNTGTYKKLPF